ncbi:MAG: potassium-transporting ATPase subunit KdpC [Pleurocapsa minor GSE-CHR-MK-17-07R]|jgi:K+-transporting ATPase ATPase C chain|nr:potassium-transporting ATPase subunit KdpC [Pleurocapsa minor GSE-CHR-MK 17-07R]
MTKHIRAAVTAFVLLTIITGVIYPLLTTGFGQVLFPYQANGSLIERDGVVVGSALIGQITDDPAYFWWRPSAVNAMQGGSPEALISSGASNQGWTSATLAEQVAARAEAIRSANNLAADTPIPPDLLFASASGLDPHISPEAAALQVARVAEARDLEVSQVEALVAQYTEAPQLLVLGQPRVNVLLLNLALDDIQ